MIRNKKTADTIRLIFYYMVLPFITVWLCVNFVIAPIGVSGISMEPNVHDGDFAFVNVIGFKLTGVKRFDTVVFHSDEDNRYIIKRVIGLPGEMLEYINDKLYVNGEHIEEPFLSEEYMNDQKKELNLQSFTKDFNIVLGEDQYYVLGDNRPWSRDSIEVGPISSKQIVGKNGIILFPFNLFFRGVSDY